MSEKRRIGVIVPSTNTTAETDFRRVVPEGITVHGARMPATSATPEAMGPMNQGAEQAAQLLGSAGVDVVAYACTGGSFFRGPGFDQELLKQIGQAAGAPAAATSPAVVEALRTLGVKRVSVVTPYPDEMNELLRKYLEAAGFEVTSLAGKGLGKQDNKEIGDQTPDQVEEFALAHWDPSADGLFCSCTDWRSLEVVERLEAAIGKPVVTSNQATIWGALRALGWSQPISGYGRLLRQPAAVAR